MRIVTSFHLYLYFVLCGVLVSIYSMSLLKLRLKCYKLMTLFELIANDFMAMCCSLSLSCSFLSFVPPLISIVWSACVSCVEFRCARHIVRSIAHSARFIELIPLNQRNFAIRILIDDKIITLRFQCLQFCFNRFNCQLFAHFG